MKFKYFKNRFETLGLTEVEVTDHDLSQLPSVKIADVSDFEQLVNEFRGVVFWKKYADCIFYFFISDGMIFEHTYQTE